MIATIICATCLFIAAVCKALADTLADHFDTSIFKNKRHQFWDKAISSDHAKRVFNYKIDAWHLANSLMIVAFITGIYFKPPYEWYYFIPAAGTLFNMVFNTFYNKIFR